MSFTDFCLSESIAPKITKYGINKGMNDGDMMQTSEYAYTFFQFDGLYYCVTFIKRTNEVGFGVSDKRSLDTNDYNDDRKQTGSALKVFGSVLYILFDLINTFKPPFIKFEAQNAALGRVYDRMVKNRYILKYIDDKKYRYEGLSTDFHIFKRK